MAQKKLAPPPVATRTIGFGCLSGVCVATDPYPLHIGYPGDQLYLSALNSDVTIKFTGKSPFVSGKKKFTISVGSNCGPETVAQVSNGTKFRFTLACAAGCPTPSGAPEMIVP